jgi:hypothetical protein
MTAGVTASSGFKAADGLLVVCCGNSRGGRGMPAGCRRLDAGRFPFLTGTDSGLFLDAVTSKEVSALRYPLAVADLVVIVTAGVVTAGVVSGGVAPAAGTPAGVPQTSAPQTDATTGTGNDTATLAPGLTADGATLDRRHYGTFRDGPGLLDLSQSSAASSIRCRSRSRRRTEASPRSSPTQSA